MENLVEYFIEYKDKDGYWFAPNQAFKKEPFDIKDRDSALIAFCALAHRYPSTFFRLLERSVVISPVAELCTDMEDEG